MTEPTNMSNSSSERGRVEGATLLSCHDVKLHFGGVVALDGVDFQVGPGEMVGIIGPNGSGKTSLVNVISGYYHPTSGSVEFAGKDLSRSRPQHARQLGISRVFQNLRLYPEMTVLENLELSMADDLSTPLGVARATLGSFLWRRQSRIRDEVRERSRILLQENGFGSLLDFRVGSMSYGQRKELELLRSVANPPKLLLLDEPTAGVSMGVASEVKSRILSYREQFGCGVVVVEHRLGWLFDLVDRVVVLSGGQVIANGLPVDVAADVEVRKAYVGA